MNMVHLCYFCIVVCLTHDYIGDLFTISYFDGHRLFKMSDGSVQLQRASYMPSQPFTCDQLTTYKYSITIKSGFRVK